LAFSIALYISGAVIGNPAEHNLESVMSIANASLNEELAFRERDPGWNRMTLKSLEQRLRQLGYRLDRSGDCSSVSRWMSGVRAGSSYPCVSLRVVQANDGLGFAHVDARRDDAFRELQRMRLCTYVKGRNAIYEI